MIKKPFTSMHISQAAATLQAQALGAQKPSLPQSAALFGASLSPKGALSPKPLNGKTFRSQRRMELMVRLENAGIPESSMGAMLGISVNRIRHIKKSVDYLAARIKITTGLIVDQEGSLAQIAAQRKEMLTQMLPSALQAIANAVSTPAITLGERVFQHRVATDLLDREGTFARVQRTEVATATTFDWSIHEKSSIEVLSVAASQSPTLEAVTAASERISAVQSIIDAFRTSQPQAAAAELP